MHSHWFAQSLCAGVGDGWRSLLLGFRLHLELLRGQRHSSRLCFAMQCRAPLQPRVSLRTHRRRTLCRMRTSQSSSTCVPSARSWIWNSNVTCKPAVDAHVAHADACAQSFNPQALSLLHWHHPDSRRSRPNQTRRYRYCWLRPLMSRWARRCSSCLYVHRQPRCRASHQTFRYRKNLRRYYLHRRRQEVGKHRGLQDASKVCSTPNRIGSRRLLGTRRRHPSRTLPPRVQGNMRPTNSRCATCARPSSDGRRSNGPERAATQPQGANTAATDSSDAFSRISRKRA